MTALKELATMAAKADVAAKAYSQQGRKIIGYLSNIIPLELIDASGAIPLHLHGDVDEEPTIANEFMERAFDPITRSVFDRILKGYYNFLDLIVLPRCNDAQQRLYYYLCEIKRKYPQYKIPPVTLLNLLHTPWSSSARHNLKQINALKKRLEEVTGKVTDEEQLRNSIQRYNGSRQLLERFNELRGQAIAEINSETANYVYTLARSLGVEQFNTLMETVLAELESSQPATEKKKVRLVLAGNGLDHSQLHQLVDQLDAVVVGDYHSFGNHFLVGTIDTQQEPLMAVSEHYHRHTLSSRSFSPDPQRLIDFCRQQRADGIVFYFLQGEEALTWQVPVQIDRAKAAGLGTCVFYDQNYSVNSEQVSTRLQDFVTLLTEPELQQ
jgi:benzoyl-CoA reductase/2-hydroxyglutaryl-CoA dehydratase subunit BcrC/BadD/HgdB